MRVQIKTSNGYDTVQCTSNVLALCTRSLATSRTQTSAASARVHRAQRAALDGSAGGRGGASAWPVRRARGRPAWHAGGGACRGAGPRRGASARGGWVVYRCGAGSAPLASEDGAQQRSQERNERYGCVAHGEVRDDPGDSCESTDNHCRHRLAHRTRVVVRLVATLAAAASAARTRPRTWPSHLPPLHVALYSSVRVAALGCHGDKLAACAVVRGLLIYTGRHHARAVLHLSGHVLGMCAGSGLPPARARGARAQQLGR